MGWLGAGAYRLLGFLTQAPVQATLRREDIVIAKEKWC
jgi:hypothetical protein